MPAEILKQRLAAMSDARDARELQAALNALIDGVRAVLAILDADSGVTATTLTATFDAAITK